MGCLSTSNIRGEINVLMSLLEARVKLEPESSSSHEPSSSQGPTFIFLFFSPSSHVVCMVIILFYQEP